MGCSPTCMRIIAGFGHPNPNTEPDEHTPWILDELSLNAAEKDGLAKTFIAPLWSQFIGWQPSRSGNGSAQPKLTRPQTWSS